MCIRDRVCLQIGKTIIQTVVNTQGVSVMAAFTAVNRVDDFAYIPQQNIGHATVSYTHLPAKVCISIFRMSMRRDVLWSISNSVSYTHLDVYKRQE